MFEDIGLLPLEVNRESLVLPDSHVTLPLTIHPTLIESFRQWPHNEIDFAELNIQVINHNTQVPMPVVIDLPLDLFQQFCQGTEDAHIEYLSNQPNFDPSQFPRNRCLEFVPIP